LTINLGTEEDEDDKDPHEISLNNAEIRSLTAVIRMLVLSTKLKNAVDANYFKKQLHIKRQGMDDVIYDECAKLVNNLRTITPTYDEDYCLIPSYIQMRKLNNVLKNHVKKKNEVQFVNYHPMKMTLESDANTNHALDVQATSLYSMTFRNYNMFYKDASTEEKKQFTSMNSIKNNNGKLSLVKSFFDTDYIVHRFKRQDLQPLWRFSYVDEYNISFLGKKRITTSSQQEQKQKFTLSKTTLNDK
jgi:hypothetical protein